jgi:hypothetical protein
MTHTLEALMIRTFLAGAALGVATVSSAATAPDCSGADAILKYTDGAHTCTVTNLDPAVNAAGQIYAFIGKTKVDGEDRRVWFGRDGDAADGDLRTGRYDVAVYPHHLHLQIGARGISICPIAALDCGGFYATSGSFEVTSEAPHYTARFTVGGLYDGRTGDPQYPITSTTRLDGCLRFESGH